MRPILRCDQRVERLVGFVNEPNNVDQLLFWKLDMGSISQILQHFFDPFRK